MPLLFLLIVAVVCLVLFTSLKLAFLIFLGIVATCIILICLAIGGFMRLADEADVGHGPLDRALFGEDEA